MILTDYLQSERSASFHVFMNDRFVASTELGNVFGHLVWDGSQLSREVSRLEEVQRDEIWNPATIKSEQACLRFLSLLIVYGKSEVDDDLLIPLLPEALWTTRPAPLAVELLYKYLFETDRLPVNAPRISWAERQDVKMVTTALNQERGVVPRNRRARDRRRKFKNVTGERYNLGCV